MTIMGAVHLTFRVQSASNYPLFTNRVMGRLDSWRYSQTEHDSSFNPKGNWLQCELDYEGMLVDSLPVVQDGLSPCCHTVPTPLSAALLNSHTSRILFRQDQTTSDMLYPAMPITNNPIRPITTQLRSATT